MSTSSRGRPSGPVTRPLSVASAAPPCAAAGSAGRQPAPPSQRRAASPAYSGHGIPLGQAMEKPSRAATSAPPISQARKRPEANLNATRGRPPARARRAPGTRARRARRIRPAGRTGPGSWSCACRRGARRETSRRVYRRPQASSCTRRSALPGRAHGAVLVLHLELHRVGAEDRGQQPVERDAHLAAEARRAAPVVAAPHEPGQQAAHPDAEHHADPGVMADRRQLAERPVAERLQLACRRCGPRCCAPAPWPRAPRSGRWRRAAARPGRRRSGSRAQSPMANTPSRLVAMVGRAIARPASVHLDAALGHERRGAHAAGPDDGAGRDGALARRPRR